MLGAAFIFSKYPGYSNILFTFFVEGATQMLMGAREALQPRDDMALPVSRGQTLSGTVCPSPPTRDAPV